MTVRENFEDEFAKEWQEAFEEARMDPPAGVWTSIDRDLTYQQLSTYQKKARIYKWVAAAVILLASTVVLVGSFSDNSESDSSDLAESVVMDAPTPPEKQRINVPASVLMSRLQNQNYKTELPTLFSGNSGNSSRTVFVAFNAFTNESSSVIESSEPQVYSEYYADRKGLPIEYEKSLVSNHEMRKIPIYHFQQTQFDRKQERERYWAGIDVSSGSFDPNYTAQGNSLLASNLNVNPQAFSLADNEAIDANSPSVREGMQGGESVSLGINFGFKLSDRWVLESGIQYAQADATTQTNVVIQSSYFQEVIPATTQVRGIAAFENAVQREEVVEYDYRDVSLNNQFQFASVPVKAGYRIIDKKLSVELNAGVAANMYLGNKLTAPDDQIAEVTLGPGADSPYRVWSFSGLAGIEFGYNFLGRFDLVVEPNYRQALNTLTKEDATFTTTPSGLGVMTGIRYNFH